jgi:hypothetical protein
MKIRNKYNGAVYSSPTLARIDGIYFIDRDVQLSDGKYNAVPFVAMEALGDGWEEIEETTSTNDIDWEQRRFELVKSLSASVCSSCAFRKLY